MSELDDFLKGSDDSLSSFDFDFPNIDFGLEKMFEDMKIELPDVIDMSAFEFDFDIPEFDFGMCDFDVCAPKKEKI